MEHSPKILAREEKATTTTTALIIGTYTQKHAQTTLRACTKNSQTWMMIQKGMPEDTP